MGWFKDRVEKAAQEIEDASSEEIKYQEEQGYMRGSKDEPLESNKPDKK